MACIPHRYRAPRLNPNLLLENSDRGFGRSPRSLPVPYLAVGPPPLGRNPVVVVAVPCCGTALPRSSCTGGSGSSMPTGPARTCASDAFAKRAFGGKGTGEGT